MTDPLKKVFDIWNISSISTESLRGIQLKYDRYRDHVNTLQKNSNENKINSHFEKYDTLFM